MSSKVAKEFAKRCQEYADYQVYKHEAYIQGCKDLNDKIVRALHVAAHTIPPELYKEMYESVLKVAPGSNLMPYQPLTLFGEQVFRLFPKELYRRYLYTYNTVKYLDKLGKDKAEGKIMQEETEQEDKNEFTSDGDEDIDFDALKKHREDLLTLALRDLKLKPLGPIGVGANASGEDELTTSDYEALKPYIARMNDKPAHLQAKI